jgi:transposase, IS5 family
LTWAIRWGGWLRQSTGGSWKSGSGRSIQISPAAADAADGGLSILKRTHNLADEELYAVFCGDEFVVHKLPFDQSSLTRWRQRISSVR